MNTDLNQNPHMIKVWGVPAATRSRAFFLWLCLLCLYLFIAPSAAEHRRVSESTSETALSAETLLGRTSPRPGDERYRAQP